MNTFIFFVLKKYTMLALILFCGLPAFSGVNSHDTGIHLQWTELRSTSSGKMIAFYGTDVRTGEMYRTYVLQKGNSWVSSQTEHVALQGRPEIGSYRYDRVGFADAYTSERFAQALNDVKERYDEYKKNSQTLPAEDSHKSHAVSNAPANAGQEYAEAPEVNGSLVTGLGESSYDRMQAMGTPERMGETLSSMGWQSQQHREMQIAQNHAVIERSRMIELDLKNQLAARNLYDAQIKAEMLIGLNEYLNFTNNSIPSGNLTESEKEQSVLTDMQISEEGRSSLNQKAKELYGKNDWRELAQVATQLANPWSGNTDQLVRSGFTDKSGVLNGPVIKANSLTFQGRKDRQHRIRLAANMLQAESLTDSSWRSSPYLANTFAIAGVSLQGASLLEASGATSDADTLLLAAEATVDFIRGFGTGLKIGVVETADGIKSLIVAGSGLVSYVATHPKDSAQKVIHALQLADEILGDPSALADMGLAVYQTIANNAPAILNKVWSYMLNQVVYGKAEDRGKFLGRVAYEAATLLLGGEILSATKEGIASWKAAKISEAALADLSRALVPMEKVALRSQELAGLGTKTGSNIQNIPKFETLVAKARNDILDGKNVKEAETILGFHSSFDTPIQEVMLKPGDILYQAQSLNQKNPGAFFTSIKPVDAADAESLLYIGAYNKYADKIATYVVKEPMQVYFGGIAKGEGKQFLIPTSRDFKGQVIDDLFKVIEEVDVVSIPFRLR